jgi:1,4-alpha-glucan branching enzyme
MPKSSESFALVLHSHLPYARGAGRWPHGEEWVHEAILGTYLPILGLLHDMRDEGVAYRMTIGLTPTLLEQLADAEIDKRFIEYVDDQVKRADQDVKRFGRDGEGRGSLAMFYASLFREHKRAYVERFGHDIVGAFADLARSGHIEILTSGATHGYLPLLDPASVHAQLAVGTRTTRRHTGIDPRGIWLPECAYAPGLEEIVEAYGLTHFFSDPALLGGKRLVGEPHEFERRRSGAGISAPLVERESIDTLRPYLVRDSDVAVIARHDKVSGQVWSAMMGYPGDPSYREFHRKDDRSGLRYWRVTDVQTGLGAKELYSPGGASDRVRSHADHFVGLVRDTIAARRTKDRDALLTVTFDAELFGHWWFEGIDWLGRVLRELSARGPRPVTVDAYLRERPARERVALQEGSWGKNNDHTTWTNDRTSWMWTELAKMSREMIALRAVPRADERRTRAARQAARELLLAQSSDWPFLVTTGQAADYAVERFRSHTLRFRRSIELALSATDDDEVELRSLERADNPFPDTHPADFAAGVEVLRA